MGIGTLSYRDPTVHSPMHARVRLRNRGRIHEEGEREKICGAERARLEIIAVRKAKGMKEKGGDAPQETSTLNIAGGGRDAV